MDSHIQDTTQVASKCNTYEQTIPKQLESLLVDSLEEVNISEYAETDCNHYQRAADSFENVDQEVVLTFTEHEEPKNFCDQQQRLLDDTSDCEK